jgi:hypothetical protein
MPEPYLTKEEVNKAVRRLLGEAGRAADRLEMGDAVGEEPDGIVGARHAVPNMATDLTGYGKQTDPAPGFPQARE